MNKLIDKVKAVEMVIDRVQSEGLENLNPEQLRKYNELKT